MITCFVDLDGVLADFITAICEAHGRPYPYTLGESNAYYIEDEWGLTKDEFFAPCDADFWANLPWTADGREILAVVEEFIPKEQIAILTSGNDPRAAAGKVRWVHRELPEFRDRLFITGPQKWLVAQGIETILVDDADSNVHAFYNTDHRAGYGILVPRPWNALHMEMNPVATVRRDFEFWDYLLDK